MPPRILVTDDEVHILRAIEFKLRKSAFDVRCAHDGEEAWEIMQNFRPDLLITDYQMPRLHGLDLVARIRQSREFRDLRVIMLTAKGYELPIAETCDQYNLLNILTKPFSPRQLFKRVEEVLSVQYLPVDEAGPADEDRNRHAISN